ncbi:twitching motility protein PilT [Candidatus Gottesmanbacteria bacterium RIFCSPHIGHO2_01_FULL_39_10]|uniref:Twitching motility protein PilT n=1 Tax=Candidatus Gottesmanbacteria bacterium RIFCSPHIGHO2_01_FULL_39_10 TaxID=1798375 RepID=A0A1F5ZR68_9BACT|nr:MAG: twitching motility protein PilT [Candidatus Gottesmanbacteria bacterium RIFCSPHIGHO2_01_FULL_39_10]
MILLDTQALIWLTGDKKKLSLKALRYIEKSISKKEIFVSSFSIWEISLLVKKGRLRLSTDIESWIQQIEDLNIFKFIPVNNEIAIKSVFLPGSFHQDPADRIIIATALVYGASIVTSDRRILKYPQAQTIW